MIHPCKTQTLYGQEAAEKVALDSLESGNMHHAWLLAGERGIGKATFAYLMAKLLLTGTKSPINPNVQKIENQSHPDLFVLTGGEDGKEIKVDATRGLADFTNLTPALGNNKVVIVDSINDLNNNAANSLLKILEEPQDNTYFFLVCHSLPQILPTIKSRCRQLNFSPLKLNDFKKIIATQTKLDEEGVKEIYGLAKGSMYYADLLLQENSLDIYKLVEEIITENKRSYQNIQMLMSATNDDKGWEIIKFSLHNVVLSAIAKAAKNQSLCEKQMDMAFKRLQLLQQADNFHLDRAQLLAAIVS